MALHRSDQSHLYLPIFDKVYDPSAASLGQVMPAQIKAAPSVLSPQVRLRFFML